MEQPRELICGLRARLKSLAWRVAYPAWLVRENLAGEVSAATDDKFTVLIPTYSAKRMRGLASELQPLLKCRFVDQIIVSNHNPAARLRDFLKLEDPRLVILDQPLRHGPGFVYQLAASRPGNYFMSVDDDVLLHSRQFARVFECLRAQPTVPHGIAGCRRGAYVQNQETEVDELYLLYAVTRQHVLRYLELTRLLLATGEVSEEDVELWSDDIVLSACGEGKPRIHKVGFFLQSGTCFSEGIAIHKAVDFQTKRRKVRATLWKLLSEKHESSASRNPSAGHHCGPLGASHFGRSTPGGS